MYVSATLNLAAIRLRALFPQWFNAANCFVGAGPTEATEVGKHWMCVYYGGMNNSDFHDGGNLGRRWRMALEYHHEWITDNRERYTVDALQVMERMRKIVGQLVPSTGPTGMNFWMPYNVPTVAFTSGSVEPVAGRIIVNHSASGAGIVADVQTTGGDWASGTAAGIVYIEPLYSLSFTSGGTTPIVPNRWITQGATASGVVADVVLSSGSWAAGDAAGTLYLFGVTGTWATGQINMGSTTDIATASGSATQTAFSAGQIDLRAVSLQDGSVTTQADAMTASGAATLTQIVAEPIGLASDPILRVADSSRNLVSVEQSYDVFSIA